MKQKLVTIIALLGTAISLNCVSTGHMESNVPVRVASYSPTPVQRNLEQDPTALCERLNEIRRIPYEPGKKADDPIYDGLIGLGTKACPCLIDKIADIKQIPDPREGDPQVEHFTVGDAAVFLLLIITGQDEHPEQMFPRQYAKQWNEEGIYTYFRYVQEPGSRKNLQIWWKRFFKERGNKLSGNRNSTSTMERRFPNRD